MDQGNDGSKKGLTWIALKRRIWGVEWREYRIAVNKAVTAFKHGEMPGSIRAITRPSSGPGRGSAWESGHGWRSRQARPDGNPEVL